MLLDSYRYYQSEDLEEIRRLTSKRIADHRLAIKAPDHPVRATHNCAVLSGLTIHVIRYDMPCIIRCEPLKDFYLVVLPVSGAVRMIAGESDRLCDTNSAAIVPNDLRFILHWEPSATTIVLHVEKSRLEAKLASYLGFRVERRIRFDQWIDTQRGAGAFLRATLMMVIDQLNENPWNEITPVLNNEFAEALMATLLRSDFHNYRHLVNGMAHASLPPGLQRAISFLRENLKEDVRPEEIADAAGLSVRALQAAFKKHFKMTPTQYIRALRLAEVRRELKDADESNEQTVTVIAQKWGFNHLGRFSAYYQNMYNEKPSETFG